jgi:hypothetical protein
VLQVHKTLWNAEERDGNGSHKQIGEDNNTDGQWPDPEQLAESHLRL